MSSGAVELVPASGSAVVLPPATAVNRSPKADTTAATVTPVLSQAQ
jgi:hypothetical protein